MIEQLDKTSGILTDITIEEFLKDSPGPGRRQLGTKGKLNMMIDLAKGEVYQNVKYAWRLKGLTKYAWDWNK